MGGVRADGEQSTSQTCRDTWGILEELKECNI
jgi:hypothetical protein